MNPKFKKGLLYGGGGIGALALFYTAYLGFCVAMHVPPEKIAFIGKYLAAPAEPGDEHAVAEADGGATHAAAEDPHALELEETHAPGTTAADTAASGHGTESGHGATEAVHAPPVARTQAPRTPAKAGLGVLSTFSLESPLSAYQLERLADELKQARAQLEEEKAVYSKKGRNLDARERLLEERERQIEEHVADMEKLKRELADRLAQVEQAEAAAKQLASGHGTASASESAFQPPSGLAGLFATGEAPDLAKRLLQLSPLDAAQVLRALPDERAALLLNALPPEKWKDYATTYGQLPKTATQAR
jgi:hypothetical protein